MASITIRNLDEAVTRGLRRRAARHGRTPEEEARDILRRALESRAPPGNPGEAIRRRFAAHGGVELAGPERTAPRAVPRFD